MSTLELVTHPQFDGYRMSDIEKHLPEFVFGQFKHYMRGQTMAYIDGELIVYKWDYDRFLAGLPVVD